MFVCVCFFFQIEIKSRLRGPSVTAIRKENSLLHFKAVDVFLTLRLVLNVQYIYVFFILLWLTGRTDPVLLLISTSILTGTDSL